MASTARYRALIEDIETILSAAPIAASSSAPVSEAAKGSSLEKKSREKRRSKKGGHNPFKRKDHLGPGPRNGKNTKTNKWKCSCATPYKCLCRAGSRKKTIRIKRSYKKPYNKEYKQWRRNQRRPEG